MRYCASEYELSIRHPRPGMRSGDTQIGQHCVPPAATLDHCPGPAAAPWARAPDPAVARSGWPAAGRSPRTPPSSSHPLWRLGRILRSIEVSAGTGPRVFDRSSCGREVMTSLGFQLVRDAGGWIGWPPPGPRSRWRRRSPRSCRTPSMPAPRPSRRNRASGYRWQRPHRPSETPS
jgi:hypothetical protein